MADEDVGGMRMKTGEQASTSRAIKWNAKNLEMEDAEKLINYAVDNGIRNLSKADGAKMLKGIMDKDATAQNNFALLTMSVQKGLDIDVDGACGNQTLKAIDNANRQREREERLTAVPIKVEGREQRRPTRMTLKKEEKTSEVYEEKTPSFVYVDASKPKFETSDKEFLEKANVKVAKKAEPVKKEQGYEGTLKITFETGKTFEVTGSFTADEMKRLMYSGSGPELLKRKIDGGVATLKGNKDTFFDELDAVKNEAQRYMVHKMQ